MIAHCRWCSQCKFEFRVDFPKFNIILIEWEDDEFSNDVHTAISKRRPAKEPIVEGLLSEKADHAVESTEILLESSLILVAA